MVSLYVSVWFPYGFLGYTCYRDSEYEKLGTATHTYFLNIMRSRGNTQYLLFIYGITYSSRHATLVLTETHSYCELIC